MAVTYTNAGFWRGIIRAMLRSDNSAAGGYGFINDVYYQTADGVTTLRYLGAPISGAYWTSASDGQASMITMPRTMVNQNSGTLGRVKFVDDRSANIYTTDYGTAFNNGHDVVLSDTVNASTTTIKRLKVGFPKTRGTMSINMALRNKMTDWVTGKSQTHWSANGTIKVYSGSAPDVDAAPTGTLLWQKATDQTSSFTWADPASNDYSALTGSLTATSEAFGANQTVGYARLSWTHNGTEYVIQGSVGSGSEDFQFTSLSGGTDMVQSTSYTMDVATLGMLGTSGLLPLMLFTDELPRTEAPQQRASGWATSMLNACFRATNPTGYVVDQVAFRTNAAAVKYLNVTGAEWGNASNGVITLANLPVLLTHSGNGIIDRMALHMSSLASAIISASPAAASAADAVLTDVNITAAEASSISDLRVQMKKTRGTTSINLALRNALLEIMFGKKTTHISANGTLKVYTGAAPDVDAAATGTELISFTIQTTNPYSYNTAGSDACALAATLSATASNSGDVGYARLAWTHNSVDYVVQGSIGVSGTDFVISSASLTSGNSYDLTAATISFA